MRDLAWAAAVAVFAAVCGWTWQASRRAEGPLPPVTVGSGAALLVRGSGSGSTEAKGSASGSGSTSRGTRGPSDHEEVTIARPQRIARGGGGYAVNFPYLASFRALVKDPAAPERLVPAAIPAEIAELDGAEVELRGFMIPLVVEAKRVREFLLSRYSYDQCCMGIVPMPNEWVHVTVEEANAIAPVSEGTIRITGRLSVGVELNEVGEMLSLYRMVAKRVEVTR